MVLVDKNQCVGCGICVSVCPDAITLEMEKGVARIVKESMACLRKVMAACPQNAIREIKDRLFFAVGTDDRKTLKSNDHVGKSAYFQIFEYSDVIKNNICAIVQEKNKPDGKERSGIILK